MDLHSLLKNRVNVYKTVDISQLPESENRNLPNAILLVKVLPAQYVKEQANKEETDGSIFSQSEHEVDEVADFLENEIQKAGYHAISQSERSLGMRGDFTPETKTSPLPHKKIAIMSGLGWIGKNNLLVTEEFGCAFCMSSVLTDMPVDITPEDIIQPRCQECRLCQMICPEHVLHGTTWHETIDRDEIVDVYHCCTCLKCMMKCKYTLKYANRT